MITLFRKYYPNRVKDEKAEGFPYGVPVEDTLEFQSWQTAVVFVHNLFKTDNEAAWYDNLQMANGENALILRDKKGKIFYQLKTAA